MRFILFLFFISQLTSAQGPFEDPSRPGQGVFRQEGQLASVRIVIGEPIRIFVTGREEAKLDLTDVKLTVRRLKPYPEKVLTVSKTNDSYVVSDAVEFDKATHLEVTTNIKNKSEKLNFKIDKKLK